MPVLTRAARKMFPKRKLDESRAGSESPREEAEAKEEQGQRNKRPRVESSAGSAGTPSPLWVQLLHRAAKSWWEWKMNRRLSRKFGKLHKLSARFVSISWTTNDRLLIMIARLWQSVGVTKSMKIIFYNISVFLAPSKARIVPSA